MSDMYNFSQYCLEPCILGQKGGNICNNVLLHACATAAEMPRLPSEQLTLTYSKSNWSCGNLYS